MQAKTKKPFGFIFFGISLAEKLKNKPDNKYLFQS